MIVQVLKRYRDRESKLIHEAGDYIEYEDHARAEYLAKAGFIDLLEAIEVDHTVTQDDLKNNPELIIEGVKEGEAIIPAQWLTPEQVDAHLSHTGNPVGESKQKKNKPTKKEK